MRVILCDDNALEREYFAELTKKIAAKNDIFIDLEIYENAKQLLFDVEDELNTVDIFLLDINMPEINGIEAAAKIREKGYEGEIIFLTVSKEHMLGAFDVRAFNYIVKGETQEEKIEKIITKVLNLAREKTEEYILFTGIGEYRNIPISAIKYFEVKGKVVTVFYGRDKSFEFISTMGKLENLLYTKHFIRAHRSFLVASTAVKEYSFNEIVLKDGSVIPLGRRYYAEVKKALAGVLVLFTLLTTSQGLIHSYAAGAAYDTTSQSSSYYDNEGREERYRISIVRTPSEYEPGLRKYVNEATGEVRYEEIEAMGHLWSDWTIERPASYEEDGRMYRVCTRYPNTPHYEYRIIPKLKKDSESSGGSGGSENIKPSEERRSLTESITRKKPEAKDNASDNKEPKDSIKRTVDKKSRKTANKNVKEKSSGAESSEDRDFGSLSDSFVRADSMTEPSEHSLSQSDMIARDDISDVVPEEKGPAESVSRPFLSGAAAIAVEAAVVLTGFGVAGWIAVVLVPLISAFLWIEGKKLQLKNRKKTGKRNE